MGFRIDLTNDTEDTLERGQYLPGGWYHARLDDVSEDTKSGALVFEFSVQSGAFKGEKLTEKLWNPEHSDSEAKARKAMQRVKLFAKRLQLIRKDNLGREADIEFADAIGWEGVIHSETRNYDKRDANTGQPTGEKGTMAQLTWDGLYPADHGKIPADVRAQLGLPPAAGSETPLLDQVTPPAAPSATPRPALTAASIDDL